MKRILAALAGLGMTVALLVTGSAPAQAEARDDCLALGYSAPEYGTSLADFSGEAGTADTVRSTSSYRYFVYVHPNPGYAIRICYFGTSVGGTAKEATFTQDSQVYADGAIAYYAKWVDLDAPPTDTWTETKLEANRVNVKQGTVTYDEYEAQVGYVTPFDLNTWTWPTAPGPWTYTQQVDKTATITTAPDGTITAVPTS